MITLKNWSIRTTGSEFSPPELRDYYLSGIVYGHSRIPDGKLVSTSIVSKVFEFDNYKLVRTTNNDYAVFKEDVDPEAEKAFPNYYDRLNITLSNIERTSHE